jgi:hypothetical protein
VRVLVACEYSGRVRQAFRARGHDAWSCDLHEPAEDGSPWHRAGDAERIAYEGGWDLMIAHPPCTYLTNSGERWMKANPERAKKRAEAVHFFRVLFDAPIPKIAMENPIGTLSRQIRKPDQIVQPWMFGHGETKATCLWLKGLPKLEPTNVVEGRENRIHRMSPGPNRWKERSRTYQGIADAMASQWS